MQFNAKHNGYLSMLNATAGFVNCQQQPPAGQSADHYLEALRSHSDTAEYHGGTLALNPNLAPGQWHQVHGQGVRTYCP
jgi:hypothetical protein